MLVDSIVAMAMKLAARKSPNRTWFGLLFLHSRPNSLGFRLQADIVRFPNEWIAHDRIQLAPGKKKHPRPSAMR